MSNTCYVCKIRTGSYDHESNSHFSTCDTCFYIVASAPYCYNPECASQVCGTRTELVNAGPQITQESAIFRCTRGCGQATRIGWAIGYGRSSARHDAQAKLDGTKNAYLVDTRLVHIGKLYNTENAERRAYARAYVDTAKALLGV